MTKDFIQELEKEIKEAKPIANKEKTFITEFDDKIEYAQGKVRDCSIKLSQHLATKQAMIKLIDEVMHDKRADEEYYDAWDSSTMNEILDLIKQKLGELKW